MLEMLREIAILLLLVSAAFWALAPHALHCSLIPGSECVPHWIHIAFGVACFLVATSLAQYGYLRYLLHAQL